MRHSYQFLVTITTEREGIEAHDVAAALAGTGNACVDPRHDSVLVAPMDLEPVPARKTAPPLSAYLCAACGKKHAIGQRCLEGAG